ncbi:MAG TPA: hypothetical protein VGA01_19705, partial [Candidatus Binatia bacterium]
MKIKEWLILLLILGSALRLGFWFIGEPTAFPDTGTYIEVAKQLVSGDLSNYQGRRTPGYPLLLILAQLSPHALWIIQMLAGLAISMCLFYMAYELTGKHGFAFLMGMTYNVNLGQLFFEANLIPETETTLFVTSTAALLALIHRRFRDRSSGWILILAGTLAGGAVMARPQFVFLPMLLGIFIGYGSLIYARSNWRVALARAVIAAGPGIFMILAWSSFNYFHVGHFTLSTQTGVGLMEHTIAFAELAPERYRTVRDVLVKHRDLHLAETGRYTATWEALPELKKVTGLALPALDKELLKVSTSLIAAHPFRYAALVGDAWVSFWLVSTPRGLQAVQHAGVAELLGRIWRLEHAVLRFLNVLFLIFVGAAVFSRRFREQTKWGYVLTAISGIILVSSILQALTVGVDNTRYGVTVQALIVLVVVTSVYQMLSVRTSLQAGGSVSIPAKASKG